MKLGNGSIKQEMARVGLPWAYSQYLDRPYVSEYIQAKERAGPAGNEGLWEQGKQQPSCEFIKLPKIGVDR